MSEALTRPVRTDAASRSMSSHCAAMSFASTAPAMNGSSAGQVDAAPKAYSLRSARFGMRGAKRKPRM
jgi:hypothetical protein